MSQLRQTEILELAFDASTERLNVAVETSALPSGAATSAKQDTGKTSLATMAATDFATEAKQDTLIAKDFSTEATLASIKDTSGIKKITDALPAGDNNIGNVDLASAIPAGANVIGQVSIDQTTPGTTNKVNATNATHADLQANVTIQIADVDVSATNAVPIKSDGGTTSATQTRPANATAYTAGDVVGEDPGENLTFSNVLTNAAGIFVISSATLEIDVAAVPAGMGGFRLHLYDAAPTVIVDNIAYDLASGDRAKYLGYIVLNTPVDLGTTLWSQTDNINLTGKLAAASTTIYGILQTLGGYTPTTGAVKTVKLYVLGV